ncbi:hypothetical protein E2C01_043087 [Portunus trituberculatus]|uniref:Uncharacterized protein n=1 Tax=Portunus trituberculatus TaxID=210409 RepID=A0A5B7FVE2_PORTR|nr:hypothetical protein [Portunus trituberculatus]
MQSRRKEKNVQAFDTTSTFITGTRIYTEYLPSPSSSGRGVVPAGELCVVRSGNRSVASDG